MARMPLGKYKGQDIAIIAEMDENYLRWVVANLSLEGELSQAIEAVIGPLAPWHEYDRLKRKTARLLDELAIIWPKYREWAKDYGDRDEPQEHGDV